MRKKERERTGIKNLKVGFNKVFGYYLDVTKSNYELVPEEYVRKQTLANSERYITQELKEMEDTILGAEEKSLRLEYRLFTEIRDRINEAIARIQRTPPRHWPHWTHWCHLPVCPGRTVMCAPASIPTGVLSVRAGRHPVVERTLPPPAVCAQ